jgi:predicted nucleotidyltransferase
MSRNDEIILKIKEVAERKYPDSEIYLYGSRARNEAKKHSDWDLLILLKQNNISFDLETELMDDFYNLELETGEVFSPLIYPKAVWETIYKFSPLKENIQKDGVRLK